jgi:hypothetical protein
MSSRYRFAYLVKQNVDAAPPLTPEQLDALAFLFSAPVEAEGPVSMAA